MKNSCLSLLVLLGLALGAEIGGNSLVQTSENNYELTLSSYGQTLSRRLLRHIKFLFHLERSASCSLNGGW